MVPLGYLVTYAERNIMNYLDQFSFRMELSIEEALYYTKDMYSTTVVVNNLLLAIFAYTSSWWCYSSFYLLES